MKKAELAEALAKAKRRGIPISRKVRELLRRTPAARVQITRDTVWILDAPAKPAKKPTKKSSKKPTKKPTKKPSKRKGPTKPKAIKRTLTVSEENRLAELKSKREALQAELDAIDSAVATIEVSRIPPAELPIRGDGSTVVEHNENSQAIADGAEALLESIFGLDVQIRSANNANDSVDIEGRIDASVGELEDTYLDAMRQFATLGTNVFVSFGAFYRVPSTGLVLSEGEKSKYDGKAGTTEVRVAYFQRGIDWAANLQWLQNIDESMRNKGYECLYTTVRIHWNPEGIAPKRQGMGELND